MKLVVVRHAKAEERSDFSRISDDDNLRPLTKEGRDKMVKISRGLRHLVSQVDHLYSSTLVRAVQTAEIISAEYGGMQFGQVEHLVPGFSRDETMKWLKNFEGNQTVMVVGHEPDLSEFISWMLSGNSSPFVAMKKGGACCVEFMSFIRARQAQLLWYMEPSALRRLG
ncbi:MAG: phosphohistidine phosphatase SixA [Bdellovibrionales bacterium]